MLVAQKFCTLSISSLLAAVVVVAVLDKVVVEAVQVVIALQCLARHRGEAHRQKRFWVCPPERIRLQ